MQQTLSGCSFCDALPGSEVGEACTWGRTTSLRIRSASTVQSRSGLIPKRPTTMPATGVGLSSTPSQRSRRSAWRLAISRGRYGSVRDVVPAG